MAKVRTDDEPVLKVSCNESFTHGFTETPLARSHYEGDISGMQELLSKLLDTTQDNH